MVTMSDKATSNLIVYFCLIIFCTTNCISILAIRNNATAFENRSYQQNAEKKKVVRNQTIEPRIGNKDDSDEKHNESHVGEHNSSSSLEPEIDCTKFSQKNESLNFKEFNEFCYSPSDSLKCYQDPIFCETYHLSGKRELKWPAYGEYSFLPHKHWVKVLQHGGVVFLYHPCAQNSSVAKLRDLADSCIHRYVLTKYHKLTPEKPLALVSWGCFLLMKHVNFTKSKSWIKAHAYKGPASHIHKNGTYEHKLVRPAIVITDIKDTFLCPDEKEKISLFSTQTTPAAPKPQLEKPAHKHVGEEIILKRLEKAKHKQALLHLFKQKVVPVDTKKSLAALGSLVFLFILLLAFLLHTKLWKLNFPSRKFTYEKLGDLDAESEDKYYESNFSLLKTGQDFISSLKHSRKDRREDSHSKIKLLAPISEDDYDMEDF